ncbi:MAG: hypothetical protein ACJ71B_03815 [Nitrososphaera sp.]
MIYYIIVVMMMTVLGTAGPVAAFATAYRGNNGDVDSLADRIIDYMNRIIDETISGLPTIAPPPTSGSVMLPAVEQLPQLLVPTAMIIWLGQKVMMSLQVL